MGNLGPTKNPPAYGSVAGAAAVLNTEDIVYAFWSNAVIPPLDDILAATTLAAIAAAFGWLAQRFTYPRNRKTNA